MWFIQIRRFTVSTLATNGASGRVCARALARSLASFTCVCTAVVLSTSIFNFNILRCVILFRWLTLPFVFERSVTRFILHLSYNALNHFWFIYQNRHLIGRICNSIGKQQNKWRGISKISLVCLPVLALLFGRVHLLSLRWRASQELRSSVRLSGSSFSICV